MHHLLSNGRIGDFIQLLPKLLHSHTSVKIVIIHTGTNEIMDRESAKLHLDLENYVFKCKPWESTAFYQVPSPLLPWSLNILAVSMDCTNGYATSVWLLVLILFLTLIPSGLGMTFLTLTNLT